MGGSQLRTPLLADNLPQTHGRDSSSASTIPRKPVPRVNAQHTPWASEVWDDEEGRVDSVGDSPTPSLQPVSTVHFNRPDNALQQHGKFSAMFRRQRKPSWVMTGRLRHITLVCAFLVLPLCGVTIALLSVLYQNLQAPSHLESSQPCSGLIVNYGASQLTSVSTWISTIASLLAPAFMALLAYPVVKTMTRRLETNHSTKKMPSPYQTGLLVELLGGNLVALWSSLSYMISRKRARLSPLLYFSYAALVCAILFGIFTQLADFWLHRATHSIIYTVSRPISAAGYGRRLSDSCQNYYDTDAALQAACTGVRLNMNELYPPCSVVC
jgi:hypothetical protein